MSWRVDISSLDFFSICSKSNFTSFNCCFYSIKTSYYTLFSRISWSYSFTLSIDSRFYLSALSFLNLFTSPERTLTFSSNLTFIPFSQEIFLNSNKLLLKTFSFSSNSPSPTNSSRRLLTAFYLPRRT